MANRSISNSRAKPKRVIGRKVVGMYGARHADTIKASGHGAPHTKAGHMTAPDQVANTSKNIPCKSGDVHT